MHKDLTKILHKMDSVYERLAKSVGINFTTFCVLELLYEDGKIYTQKEICEKLGLPKQITNSIVKNYWEQGYLILQEAKDRRNKHITLTPAGRNHVQKLVSHMEAKEKTAWGSFTSEEIVLVIELLNKFTSALENEIKEAIL